MKVGAYNLQHLPGDEMLSCEGGTKALPKVGNAKVIENLLGGERNKYSVQQVS